MSTPRWFAPTPERTRVVAYEISEGSEPKFSYYALLMTAVMIACFGLVMNSTAVVIGAMLVSPLMTPIFGVAVGMLRGDPRLLWHALRAELGGVTLAITVALAFGLLPIVHEATPEMLARTSPNLLDLLVAVFAGFAGAYALLDERVSPALPGVAIATAIVPPLATCGLCLAMGAFGGALGALLLFLANFVAILLVALALFSIAGLSDALKPRSFSSLIRRFSPTVAGFVVIGVILTHSLCRMIDERRANSIIRDVLQEKFVGDRAALDKFQHEEYQSQHHVLATVRADEIVSPHRVAEIQRALSNRLESSVALLVRTTLSKDVVAADSEFKAQKTDPDGIFFGNRLSPVERKQRWAGQVLFEGLQSKPGVELLGATYTEPDEIPLVLANIRTIRELGLDEIASMRDQLRERLAEPELELVIRFSREEIASAYGKVLIEWSNSGRASPEEKQVLPVLRKLIHEQVSRLPDVLPVDVHFHIEEDLWRILVEVVGPRPVTRDELAALQSEVAEYAPRPIELSVWYRAETVITADGLSSYKSFTRQTLQERIETLPRVFGVVAQE